VAEDKMPFHPMQPPKLYFITTVSFAFELNASPAAIKMTDFVFPEYD
jgi:hypothetical protein